MSLSRIDCSFGALGRLYYLSVHVSHAVECWEYKGKNNQPYLWDLTSEAACNKDKSMMPKDPGGWEERPIAHWGSPTKERAFELCLKG